MDLSPMILESVVRPDVSKMIQLNYLACAQLLLILLLDRVALGFP